MAPTPRRVRRVLWWTTVALAVALVASAAMSWRGALQATDLLARGQAEGILQSLQAALAEESGPPHPGRLADVLATLLVDEAPAGLTYIGVLDPAGSILAGAGRLLGDGPSAVDVGEVQVSRVQGRVQVVRGPPQRPPGAPPGLHQRPPPMGVVVQFEPVVSRGLLSRARTQLALALLMALGWVAIVAAMTRTLSRSEALEQQAVEQRHLATLGRLSAVMAHEIRNPLASLKGHAQLLAESLPQGTAQAKAERVVGEAVRLETLTETLLDFAKADAIEPQPVSPEALVRQALDTVAGEVTIELDGAPGRASLDPVRFVQAVRNLVDNALEATPAGKRPPRVRLAADGGALIVEVRDHGEGFDAETAERLFEPFFTTRLQGTGLGLAVVQRVATLHGGDVRGSSVPGEGATFRLRIPLEVG